MNGANMARHCLRVTALSAAVVCAAMMGSVVGSDHPSGSAGQLTTVAATAVDTAVHGSAPGFPTVGRASEVGRASDVGRASEVGPLASTVAGLVDVDCRLRDGSSAGTGIVLGSNGIVVTNNHVVANATSIAATDLADGRRFPAVVLGRDAGQDVAVIELIGAAGLAVAPIGDSDQVRVGDRVAAIGNAGGRGGSPTVTTGAVTALDRSILASNEYNQRGRRLYGMIEVSAAVPAGDSGGALLAGSGVIGMNTASGPDSGFAIPINTVLAVADGFVADRDTGGDAREAREFEPSRGPVGAGARANQAAALLKGARR